MRCLLCLACGVGPSSRWRLERRDGARALQRARVPDGFSVDARAESVSETGTRPREYTVQSQGRAPSALASDLDVGMWCVASAIRVKNM